jgi:uncharacterized membrane protein
MGLAARAATAGRMLQRLAAAISAELTAIESAERRADDNRRLRYAVAIGFVSAIAVPIGLIFAFLSTSTAQVNKAWSMFSHHYLAMYLAVIAIIVIGALLWLGLLVQHRRDARQHRSPQRTTPVDPSRRRTTRRTLMAVNARPCSLRPRRPDEADRSR